MCWFNENLIKDKVTFCKSQTNSNTITTNKPDVSTDKKVDSPVNTTTQNKTEISTPKKEQPKLVLDVKGWEKFPCILSLPTYSFNNVDYKRSKTFERTAPPDEGYVFTHYYLNGKWEKVKYYDDPNKNKKIIDSGYFECPG